MARRCWAGTKFFNRVFQRDVVIQSWRGQESLAQAARLGYRGHPFRRLLHRLESNRQRNIMPWIPCPAAQRTWDRKKAHESSAAKPRCGQNIVSPENIDSRIWPRTAAIAERFWSPQNVTDVNSMYQRLDEISRRLDWLGLTHHSSYVPMLRRIAGTDDISALRVSRCRGTSERLQPRRNQSSGAYQLDATESPDRCGASGEFDCPAFR